MHWPLAAVADRHKGGATKAERLRTSERAARSATADQSTATVPPVVVPVPVPADLLLFAMLMSAHVAAAGIGGSAQ